VPLVFVFLFRSAKIGHSAIRTHPGPLNRVCVRFPPNGMRNPFGHSHLMVARPLATPDAASVAAAAKWCSICEWLVRDEGRWPLEERAGWCLARGARWPYMRKRAGLQRDAGPLFTRLVSRWGQCPFLSVVEESVADPRCSDECTRQETSTAIKRLAAAMLCYELLFARGTHPTVDNVVPTAGDEVLIVFLSFPTVAPSFLPDATSMRTGSLPRLMIALTVGTYGAGVHAVP